MNNYILLIDRCFRFVKCERTLIHESSNVFAKFRDNITTLKVRTGNAMHRPVHGAIFRYEVLVKDY